MKLNIPKRGRGFLWFGLGIILVVILPQLLPNYWLYIVNVALIYFIAAWGYNLLMGVAGVPSFAQAAFFATGAYASAMLMREWHWPFFAALAAAALISGIIAASLGYPALRIGGFWLAIATAAVHLLIIFLIREYLPIPGVSSAYPIIKASIFGIPIRGDELQFYLIASITIVVVVLSLNLLNSRTGRAFKALRDSEVATEAMGLSVARIRTLAFALSGVYGGLAGVLIAQVLGVINADQFTFNLGLFFFAIMVIGGFGSFWGTLGASFILVLIPEVFAPLREYQIYIYAGAVILILIFFPGGIGSIPQKIRDFVEKRKKSGGMGMPANHG